MDFIYGGEQEITRNGVSEDGCGSREGDGVGKRMPAEQTANNAGGEGITGPDAIDHMEAMPVCRREFIAEQYSATVFLIAIRRCPSFGEGDAIEVELVTQCAETGVALFVDVEECGCITFATEEDIDLLQERLEVNASFFNGPKRRPVTAVKADGNLSLLCNGNSDL